jgi:hypothetical protein
VCGAGEATGRAMTPDCVCARCLRTVPMSIRRAGPGATLDGGAHPRGRSGCSGRLHPSSQPGQGALRLTDDQGRTAQNVPICVACTASPRRRQSRPERRVRAGSPGQCPSLSVTSSIGITSRPTSDSAPLGQVCRRPIGHWSRFLSRQQHPAPAGTSCWSWRAICGI